MHGSKHLVARVGMLLGLCPVVFAQLGHHEEARFEPGDGADFDRFGKAVAMSCGRIAVGSPLHDTSGVINAGAVYVYRTDGSGWALEQKVTATDPSVTDAFGSAVALEGDTLLVGAPFRDGAVFDVGAVYVFSWNGTQWVESAVLLASDGTQADQFGSAVAISRNQLVVGAWRDDDAAPQAGSAYVFRKAGAEWVEEAKLFAANPGLWHQFGISVDIDDGTAVIGAPERSEGGAPLSTGAAYIFERIGGTWTRTQDLVGSDSKVNDWFGWSVSIDGPRLVVGAPQADYGAHSVFGAAYAFDRVGSAWVETSKIQPPMPQGQVSLLFGRAVGISGDLVAVSAPSYEYGHVYTYARAGSGWVEIAHSAPMCVGLGETFGDQLAISGASVVAGSEVAHPGCSSTNTGYVVALVARTSYTTYCTAKTNSCGDLPATSFSGGSSATADCGFYVATSNARAGKSGTLIYSIAGPAAIPFQGGLLCVNPSPPRRTTVVTGSVGSAGQCDGVLSIDLNRFASGLLGGQPIAELRIPGTQVNCQWWGRDTVAIGSLLSDALEYVVGP